MKHALHLARAGTAASSAGDYTPPPLGDYVTEVLADDPLGLWLMDETSGTTAVDSSPNSIDGTYSAGIELAAAGPYSQPAARFSGDQVELPVDLSGSDKVTVEFWLYIDAYDDADKVLAELTANYNTTAGFLLNPCSSSEPGYFEIAWHDPNFSSVRIDRPTAATWHHYAISIDRSLTSDGGAVVAYVDGAAVAVDDQLFGTANGNWDTGSLFLGARSGSVAPLTCRMWGVAVYDYVLAAGRREAHAAAEPV